MEQTFVQPQGQPQPQGTYQPVGVPAVAPKHPGMTQGIIGLVCGVVSLLFVPIVFGIVGIILGVLSLRKGEKALGITAIALSAVFMIIGMGLGVYVNTHPDLFKTNSSMSGAVIEALSQ
ncbi:MAG: hypothetical protein Q7S26_03940 [bacterium]|nr:hypothetical protein [bacterium]